MPKYFEFEIELLEITPRIWRRFLINNEATFMNLHYAIQQAFGWQDYHLYEFLDGKHRNGEVVSPYHGLRAVMDAEELSRQPSGKQGRCSGKEDRITCETTSRHQIFNWQWEILNPGATGFIPIYNLSDAGKRPLKLTEISEIHVEILRDRVKGVEALLNRNERGRRHNPLATEAVKEAGVVDEVNVAVVIQIAECRTNQARS